MLKARAFLLKFKNMVDKLLGFLQYISSAILIEGFIMASIKLATAVMLEEQVKAKKWLVALFLTEAIMVLARLIVNWLMSG